MTVTGQISKQVQLDNQIKSAFNYLNIKFQNRISSNYYSIIKRKYIMSRISFNQKNSQRSSHQNQSKKYLSHSKNTSFFQSFQFDFPKLSIKQSSIHQQNIKILETDVLDNGDIFYTVQHQNAYQNQQGTFYVHQKVVQYRNSYQHLKWIQTYNQQHLSYILIDIKVTNSLISANNISSIQTNLNKVIIQCVIKPSYKIGHFQNINLLSKIQSFMQFLKRYQHSFVQKQTFLCFNDLIQKKKNLYMIRKAKQSLEQIGQNFNFISQIFVLIVSEISSNLSEFIYLSSEKLQNIAVFVQKQITQIQCKIKKSTDHQIQKQFYCLLKKYCLQSQQFNLNIFKLNLELLLQKINKQNRQKFNKRDKSFSFQKQVPQKSDAPNNNFYQNNQKRIKFADLKQYNSLNKKRSSVNNKNNLPNNINNQNKKSGVTTMHQFRNSGTKSVSLISNKNSSSSKSRKYKKYSDGLFKENSLKTHNSFHEMSKTVQQNWNSAKKQKQYQNNNYKSLENGFYSINQKQKKSKENMQHSQNNFFSQVKNITMDYLSTMGFSKTKSKLNLQTNQNISNANIQEKIKDKNFDEASKIYGNGSNKKPSPIQDISYSKVIDQKYTNYAKKSFINQQSLIQESALQEQVSQKSIIVNQAVEKKSKIMELLTSKHQYKEVFPPESDKQYNVQKTKNNEKIVPLLQIPKKIVNSFQIFKISSMDIKINSSTAKKSLRMDRATVMMMYLSSQYKENNQSKEICKDNNNIKMCQSKNFSDISNQIDKKQLKKSYKNTQNNQQCNRLVQSQYKNQDLSHSQINQSKTLTTIKIPGIYFKNQINAIFKYIKDNIKEIISDQEYGIAMYPLYIQYVLTNLKKQNIQIIIKAIADIQSKGKQQIQNLKKSIDILKDQQTQKSYRQLIQKYDQITQKLFKHSAKEFIIRMQQLMKANNTSQLQKLFLLMYQLTSKAIQKLMHSVMNNIRKNKSNLNSKNILNKGFLLAVEVAKFFFIIQNKLNKNFIYQSINPSFTNYANEKRIIYEQANVEIAKILKDYQSRPQTTIDVQYLWNRIFQLFQVK